LLACGEAIACAVFAELLTALGAPAQAMTGLQAGIFTDAEYGEAEITDVDPEPVRALLARGIIPVVTGFQGGTRDRATTTLGRGGSDLTAVALGDALGARSVEIYTDVSGVMTADPRRVAGAHPLERVTQAEMVELAGNGAKVMHHKAAELAHATRTPYVVKGLRSGVGTMIDDDAPVDADRPVTGLTVIRDVTFCRIIQGLTEDADRADVDRSVLARVAERGISIDMVNVNDAGVFFIVDDEHAEAVRPALADLNLALRMRPHCSKISVVGAGMRGTSGVMYRVVTAVSDAGVEIIHSTDSNITISILVPADQAHRAEQALHDAFRLGPGAVAR
jgi:aspartate kinase